MITLREIEDNDLTPLSEFLLKGFPCMTRELWLQYFDFWWRTNPAYTNQIPRGWVLEKDTTIIGFLGNIPVKFLILGTPVTAFASNSWFVDPAVRGTHSLALFRKFLQQKNARVLLFKSGDGRFERILSRFKFNEYLIPASEREYAYILDKKKIHGNIIKFIFPEGIPKLPELPELCRRFGFLIGAYLLQKPLSSGRDPGDTGYNTSICSSCDNELSAIAIANSGDCDVSLSHDRETLSWLYFSPDRINKRFVIQCSRSRDATLAGYMVFDILPDKPSRGETMQLMEMCIEDKNPQVLRSLLSFAAEIGKQNNATLLVFWSDCPETEKFFRNVFIAKRRAHNYRYVKILEPSEMHSIPTQWNVCLSLIYPPQ
jgi:hypothetical protein